MKVCKNQKRGGYDLAENRSFTRYVTDRFYNNFYSAVEAYIGENPDRLDLNIRNVRNGPMSINWTVIRKLID